LLIEEKTYRETFADLPPQNFDDNVSLSSFVYTDFGYWSEWSTCPSGMYLVSITAYFRNDGDDRGITGLTPVCQSLFKRDESFENMITLGEETEVSENLSCEPYSSFITGIDFDGELYQGCMDDAGIHKFTIYCNNEKKIDVSTTITNR